MATKYLIYDDQGQKFPACQKDLVVDLNLPRCVHL